MTTYDLAMFEFDKARRMLHMASQPGVGFPSQIEVFSHHTGRTVTFVPDHEAAEANEGWDGEECHYIPTEQLRNIDKLVIYHAF